MNLIPVNSNIVQKCEVITYEAQNKRDLDELVNGFLTGIFEDQRINYTVQDIKYWIGIDGTLYATVIFYSTYQMVSSDPT